ncbi:MAG: GNAT family N-acetyltransferase [Opitutaceae bacterium]|nr:GNAT family N-acetyltransferase [Opitutaceae bacterium]
MSQLTFSPLLESCAVDLQRIWLDHETVKFTNWTLLSTPEEVAERVRRMLVRYATKERRGPYVIQSVDGAFVGLIGIDYAHGEHEVWYILERSQWRKGFGSAALSHLLDRIPAASGITKLVATAVASNDASWRLLERNGFSRVSSAIGGFVKEGVSEDLYRYEKVLAK